MGDKGDTTKKQQHQQTKQISSSPKAPHEESIPDARPIHHHQSSPVVVVSGATPFISDIYASSGGASSSPFEQKFEAVNPKRPRYSSSTGQWKLLPSPTQQKQTQMAMLPTEQSPSPSSNPQQQQPLQTYTTASSSDTTASSPSHSPMPPVSSGSGQEGNNKQEGSEHIHHQLRKGKYVSPVWKANEMLWLARAWKAQYQGGYEGSSSSEKIDQQQKQTELGMSKGKTRADKDKEVAEFLQMHGVNRDAKTAGTKWDNMLGEFRKVYEWERGGERDQIGKSYFRLSPHERKLHRLPASFDEEVFEELSQFMGSRIRSSSHGTRVGSSFVIRDDGRTRALPLPPPPRPFKEDDISLSGLQ